MRAHGFRPFVDFRPCFDLLMPRIAPSDITLMVYANPNPLPDDTEQTTIPDTGPSTAPSAPAYSGPTGSGSNGTPDPTAPAVGC
jgi:hypothetical protein